MTKTITKACGLNTQEKTFFDSLRAITEMKARKAL